MRRNMRIFTTALVIVVGAVLLWKATSAKLEQERAKISDDSLSVEIAERWGGGLPAGFLKTEVRDMGPDGSRSLFAILRYEETVETLLENWQPADEKTIQAFGELVERHLSLEDLTEEHRSAIEENQPVPESAWLSYAMSGEEQPEAEIVLLYDPDAMVLYLAEYQPKA